jgi:uncharacterized protein (UPF0548 family)
MRIVRPQSAQSIARLLTAVETAEPTYAERGATLTGELPRGFHHVAEGAMLGHGTETFTNASEGLRTWQAHRLPGLRVFPAHAPLRVGTSVVVTLGTRFAAVAAPCRILAVLDDSHRFGFVYGTLPGHPEQGEEAFVVSMDDSGVVRFDVTAFSRPGDPLTRLSGSLGRKMQSWATMGYLRAMRGFVGQAVQV